MACASVKVGEEQYVPLPCLRIGYVAPFGRSRIVAAVHHGAIWITSHVTIMVSVVGAVARQIAIGEGILSTAQLLHKVSLAGSGEGTPAGEIHVDTVSVGVELLNVNQQITRLVNLHEIPCGSGCGTEATNATSTAVSKKRSGSVGTHT